MQFNWVGLNNEGDSLLHIAVEIKDIDALTFLLDQRDIKLDIEDATGADILKLDETNPFLKEDDKDEEDAGKVADILEIGEEEEFADDEEESGKVADILNLEDFSEDAEESGKAADIRHLDDNPFVDNNDEPEVIRENFGSIVTTDPEADEADLIQLEEELKALELNAPIQPTKSKPHFIDYFGYAGLQQPRSYQVNGDKQEESKYAGDDDDEEVFHMEIPELTQDEGDEVNRNSRTTSF